MTPIHHNSSKYNGSLHYQFDALTVYSDRDRLLIYKPSGTKLTSYRGIVHSPTHMLSLYEKNQYHNVSIHWNKDWTPYMHYVNIATPARWDEDNLKWIDLDLDIIKFAGTGETIVDDEDEFEEHRNKFNYPGNLISRCLEETDSVLQKMNLQKGIYSDTGYNWRPGMEITSLLP